MRQSGNVGPAGNWCVVDPCGVVEVEPIVCAVLKTDLRRHAKLIRREDERWTEQQRGCNEKTPCGWQRKGNCEWSEDVFSGVK